VSTSEPAIAGAVADGATVARRGLEQVCTRRDPDAVGAVYREDFVDHVNGVEFRGWAGIERTTLLYQAMLPGLAIRVDDQVVDGDLVASRWTMIGESGGRRVELPGITISRIEDGRIAEDWTSSDGLHLLRQLGVRGLAASLARLLRSQLRR
jgi:predicted ester cyclase